MEILFKTFHECIIFVGSDGFNENDDFGKKNLCFPVTIMIFLFKILKLKEINI